MSGAKSCPNCGAPAHVEPGATIATCAYCQQAIPIEAPPAPPAPPAVRPIVVVAPAGTVLRSAPAGAGWTAFRLVMALLPVVLVATTFAIVWFSIHRAVDAARPGATSGPSPAAPGHGPWRRR